MKIIEASFSPIDNIDGEMILKKLELCGRVCYKSEDRISAESAKIFLSGIIKSGHESVLEHEKITLRLICDRGVSHELVRHRIASYSQESTRYCNYAKDKFGGEITFIKPCFWQEGEVAYEIWKKSMAEAERVYKELLDMGATPQEARSVLPNSLKTEIIVTMNIREWRHFFRLRADKRAHPQMREIAGKILAFFKARIPILFDDITPTGK